MLALTKEHITELFVWLDDSLPALKFSAVGRKSKLTDSELVTILVWNTLTVKQKLLKDIYRWMVLEYAHEFPKVPCYENFIKQCHRVLPQLIWTLNQLLDAQAPVRIMDSTMLEVCKLVRADHHKVAVNIAQFGKNHQGWHYGFKLHVSINGKGQFAGIAFTPANEADSQQMPKILNKYTRIAVGDGGYTASVMQSFIWRTYGAIVISPPHPRQNKKLMTGWQHKLLLARPKVESVFDYLKEHLSLVSSFPRSVTGYLLHYIRIILGYQIMAIS
jgi:hypothetical protein